MKTLWELLPFAQLLPTLGLLVIVHMITRRYRRLSLKSRDLRSALMLIVTLAEDSRLEATRKIVMITSGARNALDANLKRR